MANFEQLKSTVANVIKTNGEENITGAIMQDVLLTIINSIAGGYMFGGVAQHSGNVGNPDYNVFYLAGSGAYTGYGGAITIPDGCYGVFLYDGTWSQEVVDIGVHLTGDVATGEQDGVTGGRIKQALDDLEDNINTAINELASAIRQTFESLIVSDVTAVADKLVKITEGIRITAGGQIVNISTFDILAATAEKAGLMSAADKQMLDGLFDKIRTLSISDTTPQGEESAKIVESLSVTLGGTAEVISTFTILAATASKAGLMSAADKTALDTLPSLINAGYLYAGIATPSTVPSSTSAKIFYIAIEGGTYTSFGNLNVTQGINIIYKSDNAWSAAQVVEIDNEPTAGSDNLVKSGGVVHAIGNFFSFQLNKVINQSGNAVDDNGKCCTDFLEVDTADNIKIVGSQGSSIQICCFYDEDKNFIKSYKTVLEEKGQSIVTGENVSVVVLSADIPNGTKYIRCSGNIAYNNNQVINSALSLYNVLKNNEAALKKELVDYYGYYNEGIVDSRSNTYIKVITGLHISQGQKFAVKLGGTIASRTIIRYLDGGGALKDNAQIGILYEFTAPADISSIYLWHSGPIDAVVEVFTDLNYLDMFDRLSEVSEKLNVLSGNIQQIGDYLTSIIDTVSVNNKDKVIFDDFGIVHSGERLYIKLSGTTAATRLITRYNVDDSSHNIKDYMQLDTWYAFDCPVDVTSIILWYDGDINLSAELKVRLSAEIEDLKQEKVSHSELNEELGSKNIPFIVTVPSGGNRTVTVFDGLVIKNGEYFYIQLDGQSDATRIILRYNVNDAAHNLKDGVIIGRWYKFTAAANITKIILWTNGSLDITIRLRCNYATNFTDIEQYPLTKLPEYLVKNLAYKSLGTLSKGYLCISDDDGALGLCTYTIPMLKSKNFPITFSLMKESPVFTDSTHRQEYTALVLEMVNDYGCSIAQHGMNDWANIGEKELYDFFLDQRRFFDGLGVNPKAAVVPAHHTTYMSEAIAGGLFGVVRCGYTGLNYDGTPNYHTIWEEGHTMATSIPNSNRFCLSAINIRDTGIDGWKSVIDYAIANNRLINIYFHDNDFIETSPDYQARRAILEGVLDYALSSGIEIIQLEDIPRLV